MTNHDFAVSNFNQAVSILRRTGHARFRRGPSDPRTSSSNSKSEALQEQPLVPVVTCSESTQAPKECLSKSITMSASTSTSLTSSVVGDDSVHNGKKVSSSIVTPAPTFSSRKPPLPSSHRKRSSDRASLEGSARDHSGSRGCHCCKRRKLQVKVKRVPVIGSKVASIPADEYSWKKHGEKRIEGSPYPRVYYKCSTAVGCTARKRVEMARGESKVLIVTYEGEHRHSLLPSPVPRTLTSPVVNTIQSK